MSLPRIHNGVIAWWLIDAALDLSELGPLPDGGHETCAHRFYRLTCKDYEYLLRRSGGRCETCGLPGPENTTGKLYIDHDSDYGYWAVRGLLCRTCNSTLRYPWFGERGTRYLANAWYLQVLERAGMLPGYVPPEPSLKAVVRDHSYRRWTRTRQGWTPHTYRRVTRPQSWFDLVGRYGPHNLHIVHGGTA